MSDYQVMPELSAEEYAELKADIEQRGVMVPIEFDELGNVLDGYHRLQICKELGIKDYSKVIRAGMSESEKLTHARKLNIARRHLTQEQKRGLIQAQLKETPEKSDRQIAKDLGVDKNTVNSQRKQLEASGEIHRMNKSIGSDGKQYPRNRKPVSVFNPTKKEEKALSNPDVIEKMQEDGTSSLVAKQKVLSEAKAERKSYELAAEMPDDVCKLFVGRLYNKLCKR